MQSKRWYPTIEALGDGTHIILGGDSEFSTLLPTFTSQHYAIPPGLPPHRC